MRLPTWLLLAILSSALATPVIADTTGTGKGVLLAQKKKSKKKKKHEDDDFGPTDIEAVSREEADSGVGMHLEQEGVDKPYLVEAAGLTSISMLTVQAGDADPAKETNISIDGELLFILGSFGVGPSLTYLNETSTSSVTTVDATTNLPTTTTSETKSTLLGIGGVFKLYFADVDKKDLVPFAYAGFEYQMGDTKSGDADAVKLTGTEIRVGGGLNFFLDSNVTFQPRGQYVIRSAKADAEGAEATKTSGLELLFGLGVFI